MKYMQALFPKYYTYFLHYILYYTPKWMEIYKIRKSYFFRSTSMYYYYTFDRFSSCFSTIFQHKGAPLLNESF